MTWTSLNRLMLGSALVSSLVVAGPASAAKVVDDISWSRHRASGEVSEANVQPDGTLLLEHAGGDPVTIGIAALDSPGITKPVYAVRGEVRYQDVSRNSFLEMWSFFSDGGHYYSRTLAEGGMMRKLEGTSGWREFVLPFHGKPGESPPTKLELNLVLTGSGRVELRPLKLLQYDASEDPMRPTGAWWGDRTGGVIGGLLGALFGCLGAVIGVLAGTGRGRALVIGLLRAMGVVGGGLLLLGMAAMMLGQPYGVYYPLVLTGLIAGILGFVLVPGVRRRYEQVELRRIEAHDAPATPADA